MLAIALFLVALAVYLPGIAWGLPFATAADRIHPWGTDELAPLGFGELYFVFLDPSPRFDPRYPLLPYFIQAAAAAPYLLLLRLTGELSQPSPVFPHGLSDPVTALAFLTVLGRVPSLLMGAGIAVVAYKTAVILWDRATGFVAAVCVLLLHPLVYYSRTSNVDVPALFWTSLGLLVFAVCMREELTVGRAAWLGLFAALATATKDASYAVFLSLLPALGLRQLIAASRAAGDRKRFWMPVLVGPVVGSLAYALASGLVFHPGRFLTHLHFITRGSEVSWLRMGYQSTPPTLEGYLGVFPGTVASLISVLGEPFFVLAVLGLGLSILKARGQLVLALPVLGIWLGVLLPVRFVEARFVLIMAYVLAFFAAYAVAVSLRASRAVVRGAGQVTFAFACIWSAVVAADLTYQMLNDSRYEAGDWFRQNAVAGDRVTYTDGAYKLPRLEHGILTLPVPPASEAMSALERYQAEFITVIPVLRLEVEHEYFLPDEAYRRLVDGSAGYVQVLGVQSPSPLRKRLITFVNPPVKVFARKELLSRVNPQGIKVETDR